MPRPEVDRRDPANRDTGDRRRYDDVREALERIEDAEYRLQLLDGRDGLIAHMGELAGKVQVLMDYCLPGRSKAGDKPERATGWRLGLQFTAAIVIPLVLGLLAAYVTLKAAGLNSHPPPPPTSTGATP
jgi:hypothetical protein